MDWMDLLAVQEALKSSPTPQFKSINSSALNLLYGPILTFLHDYCTKHRQRPHLSTQYIDHIQMLRIPDDPQAVKLIT